MEYEEGYIEKENVMGKAKYEFANVNEIILTIVITLVAFLVPTFLGTLIKNIFGEDSFITQNCQIIIGTIVNIALINAAICLKGWRKIILISIMPGISAILGGVVFKSASVYAMYMAPGIWAGNLALILAFKYLFVNRKLNFFITGIIGIVAKVGIIFGYFLALKTFNIFPDNVVETLQYSMGIAQIITSVLGLMFAFIIDKVEESKMHDSCIVKEE